MKFTEEGGVTVEIDWQPTAPRGSEAPGEAPNSAAPGEEAACTQTELLSAQGGPSEGGPSEGGPSEGGPASGWAVVRVVDTGIGIGASFLPKLFEEFKQESEGLSRSHEGVGLGLAITRQLVGLMDGHISVESEKGEGTTFTVTLPCAPRCSAEEVTSEEEKSGSKAASENETAAFTGARPPASVR